MSVKKTGAPLGSGADGIERLGAQEKLQSGKVEKNFEATLAEVAGQIEQTGGIEKTNNPTQIALRQIASNLNPDSPESVKSAVLKSAHFIVNSRLDENFRDSEQGKKVSADLSEYISNDPFLYQKILGVLQRLK